LNKTAAQEQNMATGYPPFAFTKLGVAMLSSVLNSETAIDEYIAYKKELEKLRNLNYKIKMGTRLKNSILCFCRQYLRNT